MLENTLTFIHRTGRIEIDTIKCANASEHNHTSMSVSGCSIHFYIYL